MYFSVAGFCSKSQHVLGGERELCISETEQKRSALPWPHRDDRANHATQTTKEVRLGYLFSRRTSKPTGPLRQSATEWQLHHRSLGHIAERLPGRYGAWCHTCHSNRQMNSAPRGRMESPGTRGRGEQIKSGVRCNLKKSNNRSHQLANAGTVETNKTCCGSTHDAAGAAHGMGLPRGPRSFVPFGDWRCCCCALGPECDYRPLIRLSDNGLRMNWNNVCASPCVCTFATKCH